MRTCREDHSALNGEKPEPEGPAAAPALEDEDEWSASKGQRELSCCSRCCASFVQRRLVLSSLLTIRKIGCTPYVLMSLAWMLFRSLHWYENKLLQTTKREVCRPCHTSAPLLLWGSLQSISSV